MSMFNILYKPAYELVEEFKENPDLMLDYVAKTYERIKEVEPKLNAFITLRSYDDVVKDVEKVMSRLKRGERVRLPGILVAVKDNISTRGLRTTCASRILHDYIPPYNATVIERLIKEGAIVVGKTNMDEFAMGSTTENSAFGPTRNPWNTELVPGGSSGGSAVAVSTAESTIALGSDTGGSIRCPASFTGTVGIKPTYGLVSRYGLVAYANSLEQIGPIARNVLDAALLLEIIGGDDPRDSTTLGISLDGLFNEVMDSEYSLEGVKLAIIKEMVYGADEEVLKVFYEAVNKLISEGCVVNEVSLPIVKYSLPAYYIIAMAEASSNLARFDGLRYGLHIPVSGRSWYDVYMEVRTKGFGIEVKRRVLLGSFVLSAGYNEQFYLKALRVRRLIRDSLMKVLKEFDFIISPTMPVLPFKIGERIEDPLKLYVIDVETVLANLAGIPAVSITCGFSNDLPVGLQIMSPPLTEPKLLSFSKSLEEVLGFRDLVPKGV